MRKRNNKLGAGGYRHLLLLGVTPLAMLAGAVAAQTASSSTTQTTVTTQQSGKLEEVTVSVARRAQNLQKVSSAVQVVSGQKIATQGLTNIGQILSDVPSVQATAQPMGYSIDIRGQGGDLPAGTQQGAVAMELDGVYNVTSIGTTVGFFDVDRLEILPGPQSTQYGPDADGGVVDVLTTDPVIGSKAGKASFTVGNYSLFRGEFAQNIPVNDVLALRVAGTATSRSSYFTPATTNNVGQAGRIKVLYRPNQQLTNKLTYEIDHIGGTGAGWEVNGVGAILGSAVVPYFLGDINKSGNPWAQSIYSTNGVSQANQESHLYQNTVSDSFSYRINNAITADELLAFADIVGGGVECGLEANGPAAPGPFYCVKVRAFAPYHDYSSETRLHNPDGAKLEWNLGFYHWSYTDGSNPEYLETANFTPGTSVGEKQEGWTRTTTNAVFAQVAYPILDTVKLTGGLRESFDTRVANASGYNGATGSQTFSATPDGTLNLHHFDYLAELDYDPTPQSHEYAKAVTGYRPGTLNWNGETSSYDARPNEEITEIEVGSKNRLLNNTLQFNTDFFYYIQHNFQFNSGSSNYYLPDGTLCQQGPGEPQECNMPGISLQAHVIGYEGQLRYNITPDDQIGDSFTFMKSTFDQKQNQCATVGVPAQYAGECVWAYNNSVTNAITWYKLGGAPQPHSPDFTTTITYNHSFDLGSGTLRMGGELFYSTHYFNEPSVNPYTEQPSYIQAALTTDYSPVDGRWSINAYVHNLTNYAVKESSRPDMTIGDPRTYGVTFSYKW